MILRRIFSKRFLLIISALFATITPDTIQAASGVRYALVIGNNNAPNGSQLPPLVHAEKEAKQLYNNLVQYGNFDTSKTKLVVGGTRKQIMDAARQLIVRHQKERAEYGDLPSLFAFFFTGHGKAGRLMAKDAPITGQDLAELFKEMDATFNLGFFDACFSESLQLSGKGAVGTAFNPFDEIPKEVLNFEGSIWLVSSRPDELSFEDREVGGLFTHYFIESFKHATKSNFAITLDEMWEYTRQKTVQHAAKFRRNQTPVKIVYNLKSHGPLFFSFPNSRDATLRFEKQVTGTFLIQYENGSLVEEVTKSKGMVKDVKLFDGTIMLTMLPIQKSVARQRITLRKGEIATVHLMDDPPSSIPGYGMTQLLEKGELGTMTVSRTVSDTSLGLALSYGFSHGPAGSLTPRHNVSIAFPLIYGRLQFTPAFAFGYLGSQFEAYNVTMQNMALDLSLGWRQTFNLFDLVMEAGGRPQIKIVNYSDVGRKNSKAIWLGGGIGVNIPIIRKPLVQLALRARFGGQYGRSLAAKNASLYWSWQPLIEAGLQLPQLLR